MKLQVVVALFVWYTVPSELGQAKGEALAVTDVVALEVLEEPLDDEAVDA